MPCLRHIAVYTHEYFSHFQYLLATDEPSRLQYAAELGFCPFHTWQLFEVMSPDGASIGFVPLTEEVSLRLKKISKNFGDEKEIDRLLNDVKSCRVCRMVKEEEAIDISQLAASIIDDEGKNQYYNSQGVCLHHLKMFLDVVTSAEAHQTLLEKAFQQFEEDAEDMKFYIKKEALRRALHNKNEESAYKRAIIRIYSHKRVGIP